jgi:hypothetical protein
MERLQQMMMEEDVEEREQDWANTGHTGVHGLTCQDVRQENWRLTGATAAANSGCRGWGGLVGNKLAVSGGIQPWRDASLHADGVSRTVSGACRRGKLFEDGFK